jgi:Flp pilus assembly protein TadD
MRWRVTLICALGLSLALSSLPARATLQQDYLEIYLKLNDSERLERNGDFKGALEGFQECYEKLHKIHVHDPDWETVLVSSRMEDCRAKINELQPKVDTQVPAPPATPEPPAINPVPAGTPVSVGDEATLRARLAEVEQQLATTRAQLADTQEKYKNSQLEVQTLHAQIDSVNQQLATLKAASSSSVDDNMGRLLSQNKALTDKLTSAQAQIKALTSNPKSAVAKLTLQLKTVQEKLDASEAANAGLMETTNTLQQQLAQAQSDLTAANAKLAATPAGSPEYLALKRENEVMRGILLREIQEQSRRDGAKRLAQEEFDRLKINSKVLQEQLDILGSPMSPPSSDEERSLLASLKVTPAEPTPIVDAETGNHLSTGTNAAPDTNAASATLAPATSTNTPPATDTNAVASTTPPPDTNTVIVVPSPAATDTNSTPAVPSANTNAVATVTPPADTNTVPAAPSTNAVTESTPPSTNAAPDTNAPSVVADTNTPPAAPPSAPAVSTNVVATPADTNAAPAAPTTNAVVDNMNPSTGTNAAPSTADTDPTRYSQKPRVPDDMHDVAQQATDLFKMQRYDDAAAKYQQIIDKYPESLYAWSNLGVVRSQEGRLPDAEKALQQAVKLSPNDAFSYRNLGIVYYQLNENDAAIDALERSIALEPNEKYSHDYLGCACSQKGWQEVAEKEFRKAIEIDDNFPDAHYNLAIVYAMQKPPSLELARRHYKRALELGIPKDPRLEKLLGLQ